jgi:hypothetical protein
VYPVRPVPPRIALWITCFLVPLLGVLPAQAGARETPDLFDPDRHMLASEAEPGMTGYGLTVFQGTRIERFDVRVVGSLRNTQQLGTDLVLIESDDPKLAVSGPVAGMSGSPIFLEGADGKHRLVGAFAFGWAFSKATIVGVQPIEQMLRLDTADAPIAVRADRPAGLGPLDWIGPHADPAKTVRSLLARPVAPGPLRGASPLAMPLVSSNATAGVVEALGSFGPAGSTGLLTAAGNEQDADLPATIEPGSSLVVPLMTGDLEMAAVGTCTEVIGDRVFAFGHPLFGSGPVEIPFSAGRVDAIIPLLSQSFKLGTATAAKGTLSTDSVAGVSGRLGDVPDTVPVRVTIITADGKDRDFTFEAARIPEVTVAMAFTAITQALDLAGGVDPDGGVDWQVEMTFDVGQDEPRDMTLSGMAGQRSGGVGSMLVSVLMAGLFAESNPIEAASLSAMQASIRILPPELVETATLTDVTPRLRTARPGDQVPVALSFEPFRGPAVDRIASLQLPDDLPAGEYEIRVASAIPAARLLLDARPDIATAQGLEPMFRAAELAASLDGDKLYFLLYRPDRPRIGIAGRDVGNLPLSRARLLADADDKVAIVQDIVIEPIDIPYLVPTASEFFTLTVE